MTGSSAKTAVLSKPAAALKNAKDKTVRVPRMQRFQVKSLDAVYIKCESLSFDMDQMSLEKARLAPRRVSFGARCG
jgi:hypothetical protein